jgi:hypothetical protein
MKNMILYITLVVLFSCCNKDEDKAPIDQLPPATQTGANTAGCLVNGQAFLPKGSSQFGPVLSCFYQQDQYGFHLGLSIVEKGSKENKSITISTNPGQLVENTTYNLVARTNNGSSYNSNFGEYIITNNINSGKEYRTTNTITGELKITKLNTQQKIISGTFWYDAVLSNEIVKVREGRFDMHYVN